MAQVQPELVKTWLDRLEEFLTDEFHYGLYRVISDTHWGSDIMIGSWTGPMEFFACLESLNHSSRSTAETVIVDQLQDSYEKRAKGGTRYQSLLAIHYWLKCVKVKENNTKKAGFASFLTGYGENTLRQSWSNIHRKGDEKNPSWEAI